MHKSKPSDFRMAIEEAFLAEHGLADILINRTNLVAEQLNHHPDIAKGVQEATDSNQEQECQSQNQATCLVIQSVSSHRGHSVI